MRVQSALPIVLAALAACESSPTDPLAPEGFSEVLNAAGAAGSNDVLLNGHMEESIGWSFYSPPTTGAGYSEGEGLDGTRAVALSSTGHPENRPLVYQRLTPGNLGGRKLTLTAHVRVVGVQGPGFALALRGDDPSLGANLHGEAFATTQGRFQIGGTRDWATYTVQLDDLDESIGLISVFLIFLPGSTGTVYVDDVTLTVEDAPPALALRNGGFEAGLGAPDDWWWGGKGWQGYTFDWSGAAAHEGGRGARIVRTHPGAPDDFAFWAQTLRADAFVGGPVTLRARVRTDLAGQGAGLVIRGDDTLRPEGVPEAFATTQARTSISGSRGWTELSVTLDRVPAGVRSLTVYLVLHSGTTGTVDFDAVELSR